MTYINKTHITGLQVPFGLDSEISGKSNIRQAVTVDSVPVWTPIIILITLTISNVSLESFEFFLILKTWSCRPCLSRIAGGRVVRLCLFLSFDLSHPIYYNSPKS